MVSLSDGSLAVNRYDVLVVPMLGNSTVQLIFVRKYICAFGAFIVDLQKTIFCKDVVEILIHVLLKHV